MERLSQFLQEVKGQSKIKSNKMHCFQICPQARVWNKDILRESFWTVHNSQKQHGNNGANDNNND